MKIYQDLSMILIIYLKVKQTCSTSFINTTENLFGIYK